jgi:hypothetical protein
MHAGRGIGKGISRSEMDGRLSSERLTLHAP